MSRYQVLRAMKCSVLTSAAIAFLNYIQEVPSGTIVFMNLVVEYNPLEGEENE